MTAGSEPIDLTEHSRERWLRLDELARRYRQSLVHFFERRAERDDVPDLVQDVFLRLARLGDVVQIEQPQNYLFATASNTLKDHARRKATRHAGLHESYVEELHGQPAAAITSMLEARDAVARIEGALRALPPRTRDVFVLRVIEERKMADIARMLRISVRATEKHQARALAHVARVLGPDRND